MSGAVAAHAAYNGSGTQGLAVTNKIHDDDGDVMSVFWNKNDTTRQLLYGSSIIEIPASGSGGNLTAGGNQIFTVNNDIDALGDLYLQISTSGVTASPGVTLTAFQLLKCIKRIEFMVGTQVWETLETNDIGALNMTEMSEDAFESFFLAMSGGFSSTGTRNNVKIVDNAVTTAFTTDVAGVLRVPALSRSVGPRLAKFTGVSENSYLLAGAPHQTVKIRVYMAASLPTGITNLNLKLFGQCIVMCNEEREQIKAMPMGLPKRLKMTQNISTTFTPSGSLNDKFFKVEPCKIDLDHFSLYASHLLISVNFSNQNSHKGLKHAELKLNSSSFSGVLKGPLLEVTTETLKLYNNSYYEGGLRQGSGVGFYVFPIASKAYGGSSVPFNRFDNIRLSLTFSDIISSGNVNVTCCGETTSLFKGGAASLAMY